MTLALEDQMAWAFAALLISWIYITAKLNDVKNNPDVEISNIGITLFEYALVTLFVSFIWLVVTTIKINI